MSDYKTLADVMAEYDAERIAEIERDEARRATPEAKARLAAKKAAEHALGVREGWWTEDGTPIEQPEDADDEAEED